MTEEVDISSEGAGYRSEPSCPADTGNPASVNAGPPPGLRPVSACSQGQWSGNFSRSHTDEREHENSPMCAENAPVEAASVFAPDVTTESRSGVESRHADTSNVSTARRSAGPETEQRTADMGCNGESLPRTKCSQKPASVVMAQETPAGVAPGLCDPTQGQRIDLNTIPSVSQNARTAVSGTDDDERRPDCWQPIRLPLWRALKRSIVAAGVTGAISPRRAQGLIERFHLKDL